MSSSNYSSGGGDGAEKLSHTVALAYLSNAGVQLSSTGACADRHNPICTSLEQINCRSVAQLIAYRKQSGCKTIVTGNYIQTIRTAPK